jgi:hypothetical protein
MDSVVIFAISGCLLSAGIVYVVLKVSHFGETQAVADQLLKAHAAVEGLKKKLSGYTKYADGLEAAKLALAEQLKPPVAKIVRDYVYSTELGKDEFHLVADATVIMTYSVEFTFTVDASAHALELKPLENGVSLRINRPVLAGDPVIKHQSERLMSAISIPNESALMPAVHNRFADFVKRNGNIMSSEATVQAMCKLKALECLRDAFARQPGVLHVPAIFVDFK